MGRWLVAVVAGAGRAGMRDWMHAAGERTADAGTGAGRGLRRTEMCAVCSVLAAGGRRARAGAPGSGPVLAGLLLLPGGCWAGRDLRRTETVTCSARCWR